MILVNKDQPNPQGTCLAGTQWRRSGMVTTTKHMQCHLPHALSDATDFSFVPCSNTFDLFISQHVCRLSANECPYLTATSDSTANGRRMDVLHRISLCVCTCNRSGGFSRRLISP